MATVIDALVVQLGLDPTEFRKGQRDAIDSFKKTGDEAERHGKRIEAQNKNIGETFDALTRRAITFFAVLAGAKSIEEFTTKIIGQDAALGRLAVTLGVLPQDLSAMTGAIERNGGSAEAATASFKSLSDQFEELKINGTSGILPMLQKLMGVGGKNIDIAHGFAAALPGISENLKALKDAGKDIDADFYARALGLDQETAIELEKGWTAFKADVDRYKKENPPDPAWTKQAEELVQGWGDAKRAVQGFGRYFVETFSPLMQHEMKLLVDLLHADLNGMLADWGNIFKDMGDLALHGLERVGNIVNQSYHKLTGKWLIDPSELAGAAGGGSAAGPLPGGGGMTGLRSRRGEYSGNDALRRRGSRVGNMPVSSVPGAMSAPDTEAYIRQSATARGIDPEVALTVWRNEGRGGYIGDGNSSFGPYQLHYGGVNPAMPHAGLGDEFTRQGHGNARDPSTTRAQIDFAMNWVRAHGWRDWSGARGVMARYGAYAGVGPSPHALTIDHAAHAPMRVYDDVRGAATAYNNTTHDNRSAVANTSTTNIGHVSVHTTASDGEGIAKSIKPALQRHSYAIQANSGPN